MAEERRNAVGFSIMGGAEAAISARTADQRKKMSGQALLAEDGRAHGALIRETKDR